MPSLGLQAVKRPTVVSPLPGGSCGDVCTAVTRRRGKGTGLFNFRNQKLCECCTDPGYSYRPSTGGRFSTGEGTCVLNNAGNSSTASSSSVFDNATLNITSDASKYDPSRSAGGTTKVGIKFDQNNKLQWFANGTRVAGASIPPEVRQQILKGYMQRKGGAGHTGLRRSERLKAQRQVHFSA